VATPGGTGRLVTPADAARRLDLDTSVRLYRDNKNIEVDLILETNKKIMAIEIKWSDKYKSQWKDSLEIFAEQIPKKPVEQIILYRGSRVLQDGDTKIIPFEKFLTDIDSL
jgi:predicted AAA+ superfamily ATPase